ncbi:MAG: endonuclease/exonuclease/phosphatase family protein [Nocardioides sp.]|nr:endonuclease/exonuclease/phosphatase family protein [Nocardioidaceae bacterium]MCB8956878.1 endonuclease/exonuclease/phosphatase family protein [Nocardioides sp.]
MSQHRLPGRRRLQRRRGLPWRPVGALAVALLLTGGVAVAAAQGWVETGTAPAALDRAPAVQDIVAAPPALHRDPDTSEKHPHPGLTALAEEAEQKAKRERQRKKRQELAPTTTFRVASINALGDSHTRPGGNKPRFAPSATRTRGLVSILAGQQVDVVGLQEFEVPQRAYFQRIAPAWDVFTGSERGHDSIAYRTDVWEYVAGGTGTIPYFHGNPAPMPWVTLRHRETGREISFISIHNPTSNARRGNNAASRAEATRREIAAVRSLADNGNPVLLLGDFNERGEAFCMVTGGGDIGAANGGSVGGACSPPPGAGIDWIFGTTDIEFSDYVRYQDGLVQRTTDHPAVVARATITEPLP